MVDRYNVGNDVDPEIYEIETGDYVLYADYARLEAALRECVEALKEFACPNCDADHMEKCIALGLPSCKGYRAIKKAREVLGDA